MASLLSTIFGFILGFLMDLAVSVFDAILGLFPSIDWSLSGMLVQFTTHAPTFIGPAKALIDFFIDFAAFWAFIELWFVVRLTAYSFRFAMWTYYKFWGSGG